MKQNTSPLFYIIAFIFSVALISCDEQSQQSSANSKDTIPALSQNDASIPGSFSSQTQLKFDRSDIDHFIKKYPLLEPYLSNLDSFYKNRDFAFAWFDTSGIIEQASNLLNKIENLKDEGLSDTVLYQTELTDLMSNQGLDSLNKRSVDAELMLTSQYFFYARKVWQGFDETTLSAMNWYLPRKKIAYDQLLDSLINGKDVLNAAPLFRQYSKLKDHLKKYHDIESAGGFPKVVADKKSYKKGDSSKAILTIRKILAQTGDIASDNQGATFDDDLETGVKNFQNRFGLKADGVIGASFIKEINVPVSKRIDQIVVNMERSRWVPVDLSGDYIVINIPEFKLHVYEKDSVAWSMNVVVGQPAHKTVIFNGDMKYIVFSPYWNVPASIKNKEILPAIRRNKNYLSSHNMEWYDGGSIRQKPGPNNSLGLVKFLFPNSHSIYLHDTPAKSLFGETDRAFSHGCIRLSEPQRLAEYLLRNDTTWNKDKIVAAMNAGKEKYVTLKNPVPVFIAYFTAWVDRKGQLNFRNDIYGRDPRITDMLVNKK